MVDVKVTRRFRDLQAHVTRMPGETFRASEDRAAQIAEALPGYIEYEAEEADGRDPEDLSSLKVGELRAIARERGITIPRNASKARLLGLLTE